MVVDGTATPTEEEEGEEEEEGVVVGSWTAAVVCRQPAGRQERRRGGASWVDKRGSPLCSCYAPPATNLLTSECRQYLCLLPDISCFLYTDSYLYLYLYDMTVGSGQSPQQPFC